MLIKFDVKLDKINDAEEKLSMHSEKSTRSRNDQGKIFGEYHFRKDGALRGSQNWQCMVCKKKTMKPEKHVCSK